MYTVQLLFITYSRREGRLADPCCRTVPASDEVESRDILEEAARQIDGPDDEREQPRQLQQQQEMSGQPPSYIRVTPSSISVKKTKVSSQSRKRTRSEARKKS